MSNVLCELKLIISIFIEKKLKKIGIFMITCFHVAVSIAIWMLTKRMGKNLGVNYTRILQATWNKSWRQHPTKQQLYHHLPPIAKIIQVRRTRHAWHCRRSKGEIISDILLWTPSYGRAKVGRPAITYIQQLCVNPGYSLQGLPGAMDVRNGWRGWDWEIRAGSAWWWGWLITLFGSLNCK